MNIMHILYTQIGQKQMYTPKYFELKECFPPDFPMHWRYFDDRILKSADTLREVFGPLWCNGHGLTQCGFRTEGSKTSQHRFGRALDLHSSTHSPESIRKYIIRHPGKFLYIKFLEIDISWCHIDVRNSLELKLWSPKRGFVSIEQYLKDGDLE